MGASNSSKIAAPTHISINKKKIAKTTMVTVRMTAAGATHGFPTQTTAPLETGLPTEVNYKTQPLSKMAKVQFKHSSTKHLKRLMFCPFSPLLYNCHIHFREPQYSQDILLVFSGTFKGCFSSAVCLPTDISIAICTFNSGVYPFQCSIFYSFKRQQYLIREQLTKINLHEVATWKNTFD